MKTTSRILSIGVALLLLISLCALPVFADDTSTNPPVTTSADGVYVTAATVTDIAGGEVTTVELSLIHISEPTRHSIVSRMPSSA